MVELSQETQEIVEKLFPSESRIEATKVLENDCGSSLPFCEDYDEFGLERIRFAALKLSEGRIEKLKESIQLAKIDWRDLLVMAGFAEDIHAHKKWKG